MKFLYIIKRSVIIIGLLIFFWNPPIIGQTTLLTESWENGGSIPAGWTTEVITPGNNLTFVSSTSYPAGYTAYNGTYLVRFDSYLNNGGVIRLKRTIPVSTVNYNSVIVDFAWLESSGYTGVNDRVDVEWSLTGTTWTTAGTFPRYNAVQGWKVKTCPLTSGAANQTTLYIAFKFTSAYGNDCYLDFAHLTAVGPPPPVTVTIGTGTGICNYPYVTSSMDGRTQMLYTTSEIYGAGGSAGQIQQIGLNISTASATTMNGFMIKMRNTGATSITGWITDSMTVCYSGTYTVPGTGWQMITLQTPFIYDGRNLLIEICFDNAATGTASVVLGTASAGKIFHYYLNDPIGGGCTATSNYPQTIRPNMRIYEQQYVGNLTGTVTNCYNSAPLVGVVVTCAGKIAVTSASGQFTIINIPVGNWTVTYTCPGFISQSCPVTIINNQTTIPNCGCMMPVPAYFSGYITNIITGAPIEGVLVSVNSFPPVYTYSNSSGYYTLSIYPCGAFSATFSKSGYNTYTIGALLFICGNTLTQNVHLIPVINPPVDLTAILNTGQTAVSLTWGPPISDYELIYDDGLQDQCTAWMTGGNIDAEKFTPSEYPATLKSFKLDLCNPSSPGSMPLVPFQVNIYKDDGPGGIPGTLLGGPYDLTPTAAGWITKTIATPIAINSGSFYIGMVQGGNYPNCAGLALDTTTNQMRSYQKNVTGSGPWVPVQGNYMIRMIMNGPGGTLPSSMLSYKVSRLKYGQEGNSTLWTSLGNVTGTTSYIDNSWPSLPCGPYRWAVQTFYGTITPSQAKFSNIIYKCWTANVTILSSRCCSEWGNQGMHIRLQPYDTINGGMPFTANTDSTGHAYFQNIPYGNYHIQIAIFGCCLYDQPVTITSDTMFTAHMTCGSIYPPSDLNVDSLTLLATWHKPMITANIFSETWASGNFTGNNWTISGGTNWMISTTIGMNAPSAMFNWTPQVTNYDQYLTSSLIPSWPDAPKIKIQYDIYLSNYGTTTVNTMALELWDGTSWNVLKTYNNSGGNIPWTHETIITNNVTSSLFRIRFHATGGNSIDINNWNIDNISVDNMSSPHCLAGYNFYLNNVLGSFTYDTSYYIPPNQVQYGQTYTACVRAVYTYNTPGISTPVCDHFTSHFLYPPLSFNVDPLDCSAHLSWEKPYVLGTGGVPPGLIGYNVYRDGIVLHNIPSPDILEYYDLNLDPGTYYYTITAVYNLTVYGFPGQTGESLQTDPQTVNIICGDNLPFTEDWDFGTFAYHSWTFEPSQGNWNVSTSAGNPIPTANFSWNGLKAVGNYDFSLVSPPLDASQWTCSTIWLDFDIQLVDRNANSTEKMTVEVLYDNAWHQVAEFVNSGSFGYIIEHINIDAVKGKGLKVRFRAHGADSYNILHWYIDNIKVYGVCLPPAGLQWNASTVQIDLNWQAPCPNVSGYNIYRTDSTGNLPYQKINSGMINGTVYTDIPSFWTPDAVYRYYVTAVTMNSSTNELLCESGSSDTVLVAYPVAVPGLDPGEIKVFPNPARQIFTIKSEIILQKIELINSLGKLVFTQECAQSRIERVKTTGIEAGVYFLKLYTDRGTVVKKVILEK